MSKFNLILILFLPSFFTISPTKKYFEVIFDRTEVIFEVSSIIEWHIYVKKVNKTRSLVGYLTFLEPIGDNIKLGIKTLKKQGGEYRYLPYSLPAGPFCASMEKEKFGYPDIAKQSDFPEDIANNCPLAPGNYTFYGATCGLQSAPTIIADSGEYAAELYYYKIDQHIATYRVYAYINNI